MDNVLHPGVILDKILKQRGISQRELSSLIQVPHSTLNSFIIGEKSISADLAVKLFAAGIGISDKDWLDRQIEFDLNQVHNTKPDEAEGIKIWNEIQKLVPTNFLLKQGILSGRRPEDISTLFSMYGVDNIDLFKSAVNDYPFEHFRKSSAFKESRNNVVAWSKLAEYKAKQIKLKTNFDGSENSRDNLITELNSVFRRNKKVIDSTRKILSDFGVKMVKVDRPSKTPVDGKSFLSEGDPAIALTMKYDRLDNFAFNVMHELGHVYLHLNGEHAQESFFTNNSDDILEFQANEFARNSLIPPDLWEEFELNNPEFKDKIIIRFANEIKVNPAIVWGRVCYEYNSYYRRPSIIRKNFNYLG